MYQLSLVPKPSHVFHYYVKKNTRRPGNEAISAVLDIHVHESSRFIFYNNLKAYDNSMPAQALPAYKNCKRQSHQGA